MNRRNPRTALVAVLALLALVLIPGTSAAQPSRVFTIHHGTGIDTLLTYGQWVYQPGDNPAWAAPGLDDSAWEPVDPQLVPDSMPDRGFDGIGWFRIELEADSILLGERLGITMTQLGATEIYLNGKLIGGFGIVAADPDRSEMSYHWVSRPIHLKLSETRNHLAVRYSFHQPDHPIVGWTAGKMGFALQIGHYDHALDFWASFRELMTGLRNFFWGAAVVFALLHMLMFLAYPASRENLYHALMIGAAAIISFAPLEVNLLSGSFETAAHIVLFIVGLVIISVMLPLVLNQIFLSRPPKHLPWAIGLAALAFLAALKFGIIWAYLFSFMAIMESLIILVWAIIKRKHFSWMIGIGFLFFLCTSAFQMLPGLLGTAELHYPIYLWGILGLIISKSVYLSRNFARTNQDLRTRLDQVKELSEKNLRQEREAKDQEMKRRLLETELEHQAAELAKTRELEKAMAELAEAHRNLKETQAQLLQKEKMAALGQLVAGIAHEFNSPMGAMKSMHDTLMRAIDEVERRLTTALPDDTDIARLRATIDSANRVITSGQNRIDEIVRKLKNFARLDEAERQRADINKALVETLSVLQQEMIEGHIAVEAALGEVPTIYCYPARLNQVFMNILLNAREAMPDGGKVVVRSSLEQDAIRIDIEDNGPGIPEKYRERVFDPGFSHQKNRIGLGMGLAISYQIVRDHGGTISVSGTESGGTVFTILLPLGHDTKKSQP